MMTFILLIMLGNSISDLHCESFKNCESCFAVNMKCGWCYDNNLCFSGSSDGLLKNNTCTDWIFKFDMKCHLQSVKTAPFGCRIGIIAFCTIITFGTLIFWICVYPKCCSPKTEEEETNSEYQKH